MTMTLIGVYLCPFVQTSRITLIEKNMNVDVKNINLTSPPNWFLNESPFKRLPLLKTDSRIIFESSVINEYIDEISVGQLLPLNPLDRAVSRSWVAFALELGYLQINLQNAENVAEFDQYDCQIQVLLDKVETKLTDSHYFNGDNFGIVDINFAPFLRRFIILSQYVEFEMTIDRPKLEKWCVSLQNRDSVQLSFEENFDAVYINYLIENTQYISKIITP